MKLLLPKRALKLPNTLSDDNIAALVNWVVFGGHLPRATFKLVVAALPDSRSPNDYLVEPIDELIKISYELLEDHHIMGTYLNMHSDGRYFVIERLKWEKNYLDDEFLRNFEKDDY